MTKEQSRRDEQWFIWAKDICFYTLSPVPSDEEIKHRRIGKPAFLAGWDAALTELAKAPINQQTKTKENEMKLTNEEIAMVCHNVNKAYCTAIGDMSQPEWELAPEWQRDSAIAGVKAHIESGLTMLPEDSHISWKKQKEQDGWIYGETKDAEKKIHPCMVDYEQLPQSQKIKDYLFREVVHTLAKT